MRKNNSEQLHINRVEQIINIINQAVHTKEENINWITFRRDDDTVLVIDGYKGMIYLYLVDIDDAGGGINEEMRIGDTGYVALTATNAYRAVDLAARFSLNDESAFQMNEVATTSSFYGIDAITYTPANATNWNSSADPGDVNHENLGIVGSEQVSNPVIDNPPGSGYKEIWENLKAQARSRHYDIADATSKAMAAARIKISPVIEPIVVIHGLTQDNNNNLFGFYPENLNVGDEVMTPIGRTRFRIKKHLGWNSTRNMHHYELMTIE